MESIMSAKQAQELSYKNDNNAYEREVKFIASLIAGAALDGKYEITSEITMDGTRRDLVKLGYRIINMDNGENLVNISWGYEEDTEFSLLR